MVNVIITGLSVAILMWHSLGLAYEYKQTKDFKPLESFKSVDDFLRTYERYTQDCLDNTGGGTGGIPCYVGSELWDRELNIYYKKLMSMLNERDRKLLLDSQPAWIQDRDKTMKFNSSLLDARYTTEGTMYALMRAGDADQIFTAIIQSRVLLLKQWVETLMRERNKR